MLESAGPVTSVVKGREKGMHGYPLARAGLEFFTLLQSWSFYLWNGGSHSWLGLSTLIKAITHTGQPSVGTEILFLG